jgi:hypothetical protein
MASRLVELRCPCGPSKLGRFLLRYRQEVLALTEVAPTPDPAMTPNDLVVKCRHCKRLHALKGVRSADDLLTADNTPFSRVGASDPVAVAG